MTIVKKIDISDGRSDPDFRLVGDKKLLRNLVHDVDRANVHISATKMLIRNSLFAAAMAMQPEQAFAAELTVGWTASNDPRVAGYTIHYGTNSGFYDRIEDAGTNTTAKITGLEPNVTYYLVCRSRDSIGDESIDSNSLVYTVPGVILMTPDLNTNDAVYVSPLQNLNTIYPTINSTNNTIVLSCQVAAGASIEFQKIETMSDTNSWRTVWQPAVATETTIYSYTDTISPTVDSMFYRTVIH
jgi:hypothetical protein